MAGSAAEREVRDFTAAWLRTALPTARVVHELVVGECRADLAAITAERLLLVEIKSCRDTLDRLEKQHRVFKDHAHDVMVIVARKWFEEFEYSKGGGKGIRPTLPLLKVNAHPYPPSEPGEFRYDWQGRWSLPLHHRREPRACNLLSLLWRDELRAECDRHRITTGSRTTCETMIGDMVWLMTGREIAQAVCRRLRARPFPEADAAVPL